MKANGTVTDIDDYGYLFSIQGLTSADGHLIDNNGPAGADIGIRINVGGTEVVPPRLLNFLIRLPFS